jgi:hypothetical protein
MLCAAFGLAWLGLDRMWSMVNGDSDVCSTNDNERCGAATINRKAEQLHAFVM